MGLKSILLDSGPVEFVVEASNAQETVRLATERKPAWIFLDPDFDSHTVDDHWIKVCQKLKQLPEPLQLVVFTYRDSYSDVAALVATGTDHYLYKGSTVQQIVQASQRMREGERAWLLGPRPYKEPAPKLLCSNNAALTPREQEILDFKQQRYKIAEIANVLHLSPNTVKRHLANARKKLAAT